MSIESEVVSFFNPTTAAVRIGSILILVLAVVSGYLYYRHLKDEITVLQTQVQTAVQANKQQQAVIDDVNRRISELQDKTKALNAQLADAKEKARILSRPYYNSADTIEKSINPTDKTDQLKKIDTLLNGLIP